MTIMNISMRGGGSKKVIAGSVKPAAFPTVSSPPEGYDGWSKLTIESPDNLTAENIKKDVSIAGVTGTFYPEPSLQSKTLKPTAFPSEVTCDEGYSGLDTVTVTAPDNLSADNIKKDVNIAGVVGSYGGEAEIVTLKNPMIQERCAFLTTVASGNIADLTRGIIGEQFDGTTFTGRVVDDVLHINAGSVFVKKRSSGPTGYKVTTSEVTTSTVYSYISTNNYTGNYKAGTYTKTMPLNVFGLFTVARDSYSRKITSSNVYGYYQTEPVECTIKVYSYGTGSGQMDLIIPPLTIPSMDIAISSDIVDAMAATSGVYSAALYVNLQYVDWSEYVEDV